MNADAAIALHERIKSLESQLEELRHVTLCLCLQVQPPDGLGYDLKARSGPEHPIYNLGSLLETQAHEIGKLTRMLMDAEMRSAGESPRFTKEDLAEALEIVRNRRQKRPPCLPAE